VAFPGSGILVASSGPPTRQRYHGQDDPNADLRPARPAARAAARRATHGRQIDRLPSLGHAPDLPPLPVALPPRSARPPDAATELAPRSFDAPDPEHPSDPEHAPNPGHAPDAVDAHADDATHSEHATDDPSRPDDPPHNPADAVDPHADHSHADDPAHAELGPHAGRAHSGFDPRADDAHAEHPHPLVERLRAAHALEQRLGPRPRQRRHRFAPLHPERQRRAFGDAHGRHAAQLGDDAAHAEQQQRQPHDDAPHADDGEQHDATRAR